MSLLPGARELAVIWAQLLRLAPTLVSALVVLVVGLWVIRRVTRVIDRVSALRNVDATVARFLSSLASVLLRVLLFVSVASMLGVATTSFVAIIGGKRTEGKYLVIWKRENGQWKLHLDVFNVAPE